MTSDNIIESNETTLVDFATAKAHQDKKRYQLEYPITNGKGETITELWMRRPLVRDKQVAEWQAPENNGYEITTRMFASVLEQPLEVIEELDEELDLMELLKVFDSFKDKPKVHGSTLTLKYPINVNGEVIENLTLRRPKTKDSLKFQEEKLGEKIARLAGYRLEDLLDMDLKTDWLGLEQIYLSFRKRTPQRGTR